LTSEDESNEFEISPFVKSISTGTEIPDDLDHKKRILTKAVNAI